LYEKEGFYKIEIREILIEVRTHETYGLSKLKFLVIFWYIGLNANAYMGLVMKKFRGLKQII